MWKIGLYIGIIVLIKSYNVNAYPTGFELSGNSSISSRAIACGWQNKTLESLPDLPRYPVLGGYDRYNFQLYVGRIEYLNETHVVKVNANSKMARFNHNNVEKTAEVFELLTGTDFAWIPAFENIPSNAVIAGKSADGNRTIHIGRAYYRDTLTVGEVYSDEKKLHIAFNSKE